MDIALLDMQSQRYRRELDKKKGALPPAGLGWYPYGTLNNFHLLSQLLTGNNRRDATNFWMFSEAGLRRILQRSGWDIVDFMTVGNTKDSDPATAPGDERAFCYVRSRYV